MAYKMYNHETFDIAGIRFNCFTQNTRYGFRHVCDIIHDDLLPRIPRVSCPYYNRTWERFRYESVLKKAADKLNQEERAAARAAIDDIAAGIHARVTGEIADFEREYNKLPDSMRQTMASLPPVETEEELQARTSIVKMYNIITGK